MIFISYIIFAIFKNLNLGTCIANGSNNAEVYNDDIAITSDINDQENAYNSDDFSDYSSFYEPDNTNHYNQSIDLNNRSELILKEAVEYDHEDDSFDIYIKSINMTFKANFTIMVSDNKDFVNSKSHYDFFKQTTFKRRTGRCFSLKPTNNGITYIAIIISLSFCNVHIIKKYKLNNINKGVTAYDSNLQSDKWTFLKKREVLRYIGIVPIRSETYKVKNTIIDAHIVESDSKNKYMNITNNNSTNKNDVLDENLDIVHNNDLSVSETYTDDISLDNSVDDASEKSFDSQDSCQSEELDTLNCIKPGLIWYISLMLGGGILSIITVLFINK